MSGNPLKFDTVLDLCQHNHRRIVLAALADRRQSVATNDLTKEIVKRDHPVPPTETSGETVTRIETALHHVHLPRLEDAALVEHDPERQLVKPTAQFARGEPHLSAILDADPALATPPEV
ncbi:MULTISPECIES: DUF7344 domain-containing protein [Halorussus]|uniref:DUF7344 domain-containing protein n=1 Tax=Halorussus TaxID=1070314 RepID=UPI0020A200D5|nr:hypothetical protein [Halorussus vallis]USZ77363.1 hypothetical protein NGM07_08530 [Halorussus vallis]